jgi:hypothetical protein
MKRRGMRRMDDLMKTRMYCKLNEEALNALCGELALEEAMHLL